jgi:hypothetical protein
MEAERLAQLLRMGDEEPDRLVNAYREEEPKAAGIARLESLLVALFQGKALPPDFGKFLEAEEGWPQDEQSGKRPPPGWFVDGGGWDRVARGQELYAKYSRSAVLVLGCASLPQCYANGEIASSLIMSGRLAAQVERRLGETADFLDAVMTTGALQGDGDGLVWIRRVRLIHAVMRALLREKPDDHKSRPVTGRASDALLRLEWKADRFPIDQLEMAFVLLTFSLVVLEGWRSLGIFPSARECEDYLFAWAAIGRMLGIEEDLVLECLTLDGARTLSRSISALQQGPARSAEATRAGRLLSATLLVVLRDRVVSEAPLPPGLGWLRPSLKSLPRSLIRRLNGAETAAVLWVERAPFVEFLVHWMLIGLRALTKQATSAVGATPTETDLCSAMGGSIQRQFCKRAPRQRPAAGSAPASPG